MRDTSFLQTTVKNVAILPHARAPMVAVSLESHYEISVPHPWQEMSSKHLTQLTWLTLLRFSSKELKSGLKRWEEEPLCSDTRIREILTH